MSNALTCSEPGYSERIEPLSGKSYLVQLLSERVSPEADLDTLVRAALLFLSRDS